MEQDSTQTTILPVSGKDSLYLALLKFLSCIAVIYVHAYTPQYGAFAAAVNKLPLFHYVAEITSKYIATVAVPVFFAVSGYLYFSKKYTQKWHIFMGRKVKSILLPYILWNSLAIGYIFIFQLLPAVRNIFPANKIIADFGVGNWLDAYIGWGNEWYPFLYPLWFLPSLFAVFAVVHIFRGYLYKHDWPVWVLTGVNIVSFIYVPLYLYLADYGPFLRLLYAIAFFTAGKLLLKNRPRLENNRVLCIALAIFAVSVVLEFVKIIPDTKWLIVSLYSGLTAIFIIAGKVVEKFKKIQQPVLFLSGFSFLIYLTHEFALTAIFSLIYPVLPLNSTCFLTVYFSVPLLLAILLICGGWCLKKLLPQVYIFLFGGH